MAVSNDIFYLVKTMTRKEKSFFRRYFHLHSAGKNGAALKLFEEIVSYCRENETYDEEKLKNNLDEGVIKHLAVVKNNLYNLLLKSLQEYSGETNNETKVKNLIEQHDILFSKSLLKQSQNALKRAKKIAEENELFLLMHNILNKERTLAKYMLDVKGFETEVDRVCYQTKNNLEKLVNASDMSDLGSRFTLMLQKYPTSKARDTASLNETKKIIEHSLLQNELLMLSDSTRKRFYNIKSVACEWGKDYIAGLSYAKKYTELVEIEVKTGKSTIHEYITSLYSMLVKSVRAQDLNEYETAYNKLEGIPARFKNITERDKTEVNYYKGISIFSLSADGHMLERGNAMLTEAEENYRFYERTLNIQQKIIWYYVIARMCFFHGEYDKSGKWLNRLIAIPNVDLSQDYQCYARIMNLIVAYESGNPDLIEHALRMAYYFLTKRNKVYSYEKIILDYVRKSFRVKTDSEINEMFELMHRDLLAIHNDPFEENAFDAFNLIPWLEKKINK